MFDTADKPSLGQRLDRRGILGGAGAALVAVTGVAAASVVAAPPAEAANGDELIVGSENEGESTTGLAVPSGAAPALSLANPAGPALALVPVDDEEWDGSLNPGEIASTTAGPFVGVDYGEDSAATILVTGIDLTALPQLSVNQPLRLLDTRTAAGRVRILRTSAGALDSAGRLQSGGWLDLALAPSDAGFELSAVLVNLTAVTPSAAGYLTLYPGPTYPGTSNLNFNKGVTVANFAVVGLSVVEDVYSVRVRSTAPAWVVVDLSGTVASSTLPATGPPGAARSRSMARRLVDAQRRIRSAISRQAGR